MGQSIQALSRRLAQLVARQEAAFVKRRPAACAALHHFEDFIRCHCAGRGQPITVADGLLRSQRRQCLPLWQDTRGIDIGGFVGQLAGGGLTRVCAAGKADDQYGAEKNAKCRHLQLTQMDRVHFSHALANALIHQGRTHDLRRIPYARRYCCTKFYMAPVGAGLPAMAAQRPQVPQPERHFHRQPQVPQRPKVRLRIEPVADRNNVENNDEALDCH